MSDASHTPDAAQSAQAVIQQQLKRDELLRKLGYKSLGFVRQLGNAQNHNNKEPGPSTHMLSWKPIGAHDKRIYSQEVIDGLLDYIFMLEEQLAIDAMAFRERSIERLIDNHHLDGFTPAKS
jgi:hypothetical protein